MTTSPSIECAEIHRISPDDACALVDELLGAPESWAPHLVRYRLTSTWQRDWKVEVGQWLHFAREHRFLSDLLQRLQRAQRVHRKFEGERHPNEKSHLDLTSELAPAMAAHYLAGTGWQYSAWEPKRPPARDVDVELVAPSNAPVALQVKAPDQPGQVIAHRIVNGENDGHVLHAIEKARDQLDEIRQASLIVVSAQRRWPISQSPEFAVAKLLGPTTQIGTAIVLPRDQLGCFYCPAWRRIGGVMFLDHVRGERFLYSCTVLLNPAADEDVRCQPGWFPRARVLWHDDECFRWQGGHPGGPACIYDGTKIVTPWWRPERASSATPPGASLARS
jgi:hypothetical protein